MKKSGDAATQHGTRLACGKCDGTEDALATIVPSGHAYSVHLPEQIMLATCYTYATMYACPRWAPNKVLRKMAKKQKVTADVVAAEIAAVPTAPVAVTMYELGKLPRNGLHDGTKHGKGGTAGTYAAVCAALAEKDGQLDMATIQRVCAENNDKGFARYAVRNHWLLPISNKA